MLPAAHPAPELVELAEAEALRVLHHHQCRVRHVDANLDDRGAHQNIDVPGDDGGHDPLFFLRLHLPMDAGDAQ